MVHYWKSCLLGLYVKYMLWSGQYRLEWLCIAIEILNTMLYVRGNNECTYLFNWLLYSRYVICQISISDIMMLHVLLITLPTKCQSTLSNFMMNVHVCVTDNTTHHMVYVRLMLLWISYYNIACQYHSQMTLYTMLYVGSICQM